MHKIRINAELPISVEVLNFHIYIYKNGEGVCLNPFVDMAESAIR